MGSDIKSELSKHIEQVLTDYGLVISCLIIGMIIGWYLKMFLVDRKYNKQIEIRFKEKDQRIAELNYIVSERLNKVTVKKEDKTFFKRLKKYFRKFAVKK